MVIINIAYIYNIYNIYTYIHIYIFAPRSFLNKLLNKFSYPDLGCPMDFIPWDPSCCSFHTPGSFLPPWYPALKMTAP